MAGRLPQISMEPAPGFLPFVETHLAELRRDARSLTGDGTVAQEVSSGVLTDVALRWYWFELLRLLLGRRDAARAFLDVALNRRCARRLRESDDGYSGPAVHVEPADTACVAATGWYPEPDVTAFAHAPAAPGPEPARQAPKLSSAAVRLAMVGLAPPPTPSAVLEAVIAWIHAYETYVRWRRIAAAALVVAVMAVLVRLRSIGAAY